MKYRENIRNLILLLSLLNSKLALADAYGYYPNSPLHLGGSFDPRKM